MQEVVDGREGDPIGDELADLSRAREAVLEAMAALDRAQDHASRAVRSGRRGPRALALRSLALAVGQVRCRAWRLLREIEDAAERQPGVPVR
jgi:hypothetical protein